MNKETRDKNLTDLKALFDKYIDREIERVNKEIDILDKILKGHGGEAILGLVNEKISELSVLEIQKFLEG
uniref:Uncharacterized protein n=1 Tax=Dictyoglomus turgidum TaxID=513050 RepID=A0A7C3SN47_9BACT